MASISNTRKKIRFFILLKIKLGLFQRAFWTLANILPFLKTFQSLSYIDITNGLLSILTIIISFM